MKRYIKDQNIYITEYSSLGEFISDVNSLPNNKFFANREPSSQRTEKEGGDWYKTVDYSQATYMMTHGWDSAAEKMASKVKMTNSIQAVARSSKPTYGVVGFQASVPRYLQGIPTNMVSRQTVYSKQKVVTITKGISYSGWWSAEAILRECIKALQIVQSMENGGQRVRLNVMVSSTQSFSEKNHSICKVCIKQPDERLNISKMSFALAHPSMLRRFFFKWIEVDPFVTFDLGEGYGKPASSSIINKALTDNEYYIPEKIDDMDELIKTLQSGKAQRSTAQ